MPERHVVTRVGRPREGSSHDLSLVRVKGSRFKIECEFGLFPEILEKSRERFTPNRDVTKLRRGFNLRLLRDEWVEERRKFELISQSPQTGNIGLPTAQCGQQS